MEILSCMLVYQLGLLELGYTTAGGFLKRRGGDW